MAFIQKTVHYIPVLDWTLFVTLLVLDRSVVEGHFVNCKVEALTLGFFTEFPCVQFCLQSILMHDQLFDFTSMITS